MADDFLVGLLAFFVFISFIFFFLLGVLLRRRRKRNYVWAEVKRAKDTIVKLVPPNDDGKTVTVGKDSYFMLADAMDIYDGGRIFPDPHPRFRYREGSPWPYRYGVRITKTVSENPGHAVVTHESFDEPVTVSSRALKIWGDDDTMAQIYRNKLQVLLVLVLLAVLFLGVMVIGLYAK